MPRAWKISPGKGASHWEKCRDNGCILLGWRELANYRDYANPEDALKELRRIHGRGAKGASRGAAEMVCQFRKEIKEGDIIVANEGYRRIRGIGVVLSDYIPPASLKHPLPDEEWLPHARMVNWRFTDAVTMRDHFFVQRTLAPLNLDRCDEIWAKYTKKHAILSTKLEKLFTTLTEHTPALEAADIIEPPAKVEVTVTRVVRDTAVAAAVKRMHKNRCQICNKRIELADGLYYSEAHHIQPLGGEHKGPDVAGNILCVCPNHHAELDFGARRLVHSHLYHADEHDVVMEFINYHNNEVYRA